MASSSIHLENTHLQPPALLSLRPTAIPLSFSPPNGARGSRGIIPPTGIAILRGGEKPRSGACAETCAESARAEDRHARSGSGPYAGSSRVCATIGSPASGNNQHSSPPESATASPSAPPKSRISSRAQMRAELEAVLQGDSPAEPRSSPRGKASPSTPRVISAASASASALRNSRNSVFESPVTRNSRNPPRCAMEALELEALQGKLRILDTQRELSAVRCAEFVNLIQRSWPSLEECKRNESTNPAASGAPGPELRQSPELRQAEPGRSGLLPSRREYHGRETTTTITTSSGPIPRSRSAVCCSAIHRCGSGAALEGSESLKTPGSGTTGTGTTDSSSHTTAAANLKKDLSFYEDSRSNGTNPKRGLRRGSPKSGSRSAEFPLQSTLESMALDSLCESTTLDSLRCGKDSSQTGSLAKGSQLTSVARDGTSRRSSRGVDFEATRNLPGYRERRLGRSSLRRHVSVNSSLDAFATAG
ncbi:hypothetical protein CLOM_g13680 [Closterium sp. NIES-68]|nr:hypothetical protein CLOM_g13680 [Closterium sp. NIES-68]GJP59800.1 hypothetical protein CLOP_g15257 [Closterium sp. NIES-67]